ncbi:cyclin [Tritrichomonas foetus]|uniref:Cyclin n=1 Tax=Tritrichomonas foetus TaxID=1144522 RepID=A0A1J4J661_9EUKA|nr:cyclin [Tritrichomonas foetus]|eukprot:OHS94702.1 cyclin [Tritrichomonas foetus]
MLAIENECNVLPTASSIKQDINSTESMDNTLQNEIYADDYSDPDIYSDSSESEEEEVDEQAIMYNKIRMQLYNEEKSVFNSIDKKLSIQTEINLAERDNAALWMMNINQKWGFPIEILLTAVTYLDILLSRKIIQKEKLLLMAAVCFRTAAKVEVKKYPNANLFNQASGTTFSFEEMNLAEFTLIEALDFKLSYPNVKTFMRMIMSAAKVNDVAHFLIDLIIEKVSMMNHFMNYYPSIIAASIVAVTLAGTGNFDEARKVIVGQIFPDEKMLKECLHDVKEIGAMFVSALSHFDRASDPIVKYLENVKFDFPVSRLVY